MERHPSSAAEFNNDNVNNDQRRVESIYMMRQKIDLGWEGGGVVADEGRITPVLTDHVTAQKTC